MIGLDYCAYERLKSGMCRNVIRPVGDEYDVVRSDYGLLPVPNYAVAITSVKVVAEDEYDRYHQDPDPEYDECADNSCLNGGKGHGAWFLGGWRGLMLIPQGMIGTYEDYQISGFRNMS